MLYVNPKFTYAVMLPLAKMLSISTIDTRSSPTSTAGEDGHSLPTVHPTSVTESTTVYHQTMTFSIYNIPIILLLLSVQSGICTSYVHVTCEMKCTINIM